MTKRIHKRFPTDFELPEQVDCIGLRFDKHGYRVYVVDFFDPKDVFEISFGKPLAQRSADEGKYLAMAWKVDKDDPPYGHLTLVEGSDYLDWFIKESCGIYQKEDIKHVAILSENEWVEVLCLRLPTIRRYCSLLEWNPEP